MLFFFGYASRYGTLIEKANNIISIQSAVNLVILNYPPCLLFPGPTVYFQRDGRLAC